MADLSKRSTGAKPYVHRPRKSSPAKQKPKPSEKAPSVAESAGALEADRKSTADERRAVLLAALRLASSIADDPSMPPSARTAALTNARQLLQQIQAEDAIDQRGTVSWANLSVQAV